MQFGNPHQKDGMKCFECKRLAMENQIISNRENKSLYLLDVQTNPAVEIKM